MAPSRGHLHFWRGRVDEPSGSTNSPGANLDSEAGPKRAMRAEGAAHG